MSCKKFDAVKMARYIEGQMTEKEAIEYEKHLKKCPYCYKIYREYKEEAKLIKEYRGFKIPPDLLKKAINLINIEKKTIEIPFLSLKILKDGLKLLELARVYSPSFKPVTATLSGKERGLLKEINFSTSEAMFTFSMKGRKIIHIDIKFKTRERGKYLKIKKDNNSIMELRIRGNQVDFDIEEKGKFALFIDKTKIFSFVIN